MRRYWSPAFRTDAIGWFLLYTLLWYLLTGGDGWLFALPVILCGTGLSLWLQLRVWRLRLLGVPGFALFFIRAMVAGAWDVARRALHPRCPVQPAWLLYPLSSENPRVHLICTALVGLLPGTLVAEVDTSAAGEQQLHVHVLDGSQPHDKTLAVLERYLDRLLPMEHT